MALGDEAHWHRLIVGNGEKNQCAQGEIGKGR